MKYKKFDQMNCSLAQTLDIIGERWTLLILRNAFLGARKFGQFQENLDIARNILSSRLKRLVAEGILKRVAATDRAHPEYQLTDKGLALQPVLLAMTHWGDQYKANPKGARLTFVERDTERPIRTMAAISQDGRTLLSRDIKVMVGPALQAETATNHLGTETLRRKQ